MLTLQPENQFEKYLCDSAFSKGIPISGTFELTPVCNMDCRMCYIRMSRQEMQREGRLLGTDEWLRIGREAACEGAVFILLTGGEPLMRRDFCDIYNGLRAEGIFVSVNTNGTLIDDKIVKLFKSNMPRKVNISLYGTNGDAYADLCRNREAYAKTISGIKRLLDAGIRVKLNFTLTALNRRYVDEVSRLSDELGVPVAMPTYNFPPVRKAEGGTDSCAVRMTAQEAAAMQLHILSAVHGGDFKAEAQRLLAQMDESEAQPRADAPRGFLCTAGVSSFWVNWKGEVSPCGMVQTIRRSLIGTTFAEGWGGIKEASKGVQTSSRCFNCRYRKTCQNCGASSLAETGRTDSPTPYHCDTCREFERLLRAEAAK